MTKLIKNNGNGSFRLNTKFTAQNYSNWEIIFKIFTPSSLSNCTLLNTEVNSIRLDLESNGTLNLFLNNTSTNWDISGEAGVRSTSIFETNTIYYIKINFTGSEYNVYYSLDNTTYIHTGITLTSTSKCMSSYLRFIPVVDSNYFKGSFDIDAIKITINTSTVFFNASTSSSTGIYKTSNIQLTGSTASNFSINDYICCNGFNLNSYLKIIMKITTSSIADATSTKRALICNEHLGIFYNQGKIGLALTSSDPIYAGTLVANTSYYIGYLFNGSEHSLYYINASSFNSYEDLPDFNETLNTCTTPWIKVGSTIINNTNIFVNTIYIGSNKSFYFNGSIDLGNTIISNNITTYNVSKNTYVPAVGTKVLNQTTSTINVASLSSLYKLTVSAVYAQQSLSDYTVTFNTAGIHGYYYYETSSNSIYVLPNTSVEFSVKAEDLVPVTETVIVNQQNLLHTTTLTDGLVTLTVNAFNENNENITEASTVVFEKVYPQTDKSELILNKNKVKTAPGTRIKVKVYNSLYQDYVHTSIITLTEDTSINVNLLYYTLKVNGGTGDTITLTLTSGKAYTTPIIKTDSATIKVTKGSAVHIEVSTGVITDITVNSNYVMYLGPTELNN